jgi:hypothetical protein
MTMEFLQGESYGLVLGIVPGEDPWENEHSLGMFI